MSQTLRGTYESFRKDVLPGLCVEKGYSLGGDISVTYIPSSHIDVRVSDSDAVEGLQARLGSEYEGSSLIVTA